MNIKQDMVGKKWLAAVAVCLAVLVAGALYATLSSPISTHKKGTALAHTEADPLLASAQAYNLGLIYFNNYDYENAINEFKAVAGADPHYTEVQAKTQEAKILAAQQLLINAKDHLASNEFDDAVDRLNKALAFDPNLTEASTLLQVVQQRQQAYLENVEP